MINQNSVIDDNDISIEDLDSINKSNIIIDQL
jgi:hypothetical protein